MRRLLFALFALTLAAAAPAQLKLGGSADNLLEPEKAFRFSARTLDASTVEVTFAIASGYYLYRDRLKFAAEGNPDLRLGAAELPRGMPHKDEFFGEMQIYRGDVRIRLPVQGEGRFDLLVTSQGCGFAKPDPRILQVALDGLGVRPRQALYIGDDPAVDGAAARAAGVPFVWMDRGDPLRRARPRQRVRSLAELPQLL